MVVYKDATVVVYVTQAHGAEVLYLIARARHANVVTADIASELTGFLWTIAQEAHPIA